MSEERPRLLARLWHACVLILGSVFCVWLAVQLLAQVWLIVVICLVIAAVVAGLVWWLRMRGSRW